MHGVLEIVMDDDFVTAYHHGIVLKCADGKMRRIYPRLFTYSADYPEKYVLSSPFAAAWLTNLSKGCSLQQYGI